MRVRERTGGDEMHGLIVVKAEALAHVRPGQYSGQEHDAEKG